MSEDANVCELRNVIPLNRRPLSAIFRLTLAFIVTVIAIPRVEQSDIIWRDYFIRPRHASDFMVVDHVF